jgi:DNA-binding transcriptional LysR family regulator
MPVAFGRLHVAPAMAMFLRQFPKMRLDIRLTDTMANLVEERIDVAIRLGALSSSNLIARKLAPHRRVICASQDYLGEHGMPTTPQDLTKHNCLVFDYLTGDSIWTLTCDGKSEKVSVSGNLRATGSEFLREAAVGGVGLLLMPTWLVGDDIAAGRLVPVLKQWSPTLQGDQGAVWAVFQQNRRGSKKLAVFLDFLAKYFGSPPYWDRYDALPKGE